MAVLKGAKNRFLALLLGFLSLLFFIFALRYFLAVGLHEYVDNRIQQWSLSAVPSQKQINLQNQYLQLAETFAWQDSYQRLITGAKLYQWQALLQQNSPQISPDSVAASLQQAKVRYQQAATLMPETFAAWYELSIVKANLQEFDAQFALALQAVDALKGVNSALYWQKVSGVLPYWQALSFSQKTQLLKDIAWLLQTQFVQQSQLLALIKNSAAQPVFCQYVKSTELSQNQRIMQTLQCPIK
ncbi:hypothetical protein [Thiosulfatimonas sediminis]|uniref:hypothetical protein n=1 Tax=Thiosulfatimonas sediminis TaxID=2675054 RepID=UPI0015678579|nr:hypothetical protein [Thiosulfatimonas sediminis]